MGWSGLTSTNKRRMFTDMSKFGTRISLIAATSLLFANVACTCALAETHAGHEAPTEHSNHHAQGHSEHQHGQAAHTHEAPADEDPSCHQMLAECPECGVGAALAVSQDREPRVSWIQSDFGDQADHLLAITDPTTDPRLVTAWSVGAGGPAPPAVDSPITRKDQLTE